MDNRTRASWLVYTLGALCAGAIVAAVLVVGPASGSQRAATRTATVAEGVVQSTVSGTGNLQSTSQLNLGFKTSGTVTDILVKQGQQVTPGELLATLDPQSAEVTLEQARAALQSAEANLAKEEEPEGEGAAGASGGSGAGKNATKGEPSTSSSKATVSPATRAANLASARAAVRSDRLTVQSDEQSVQDTKLYAPDSGTIAALSGQVGEEVSATGTTRATSSAASSSSSATGASTPGGGSSARSGAAAATSSASSSSPFAVLSDLSSMELVVPLSESEIGNVRVGQIATVTIEALASHKVAAHVSEVAILSTSNSGVVSYNVTFRLDQAEAGLKPGMSATAEVVVKQAQGVNVPTSAVSGGAATVLQSGKQVRRRVVTGLTGNSTTIVLSGLRAGETVVLPTTTTSGTTSTSSLRGRGLGSGGGLSGGGFPAGAFLRGGG